MPTNKLYDLACKTGEYQAQDGSTKANWLNVGAVMQKDDGGKFIILDRTFNPAGVSNHDGRSNVLLSMFPPKDHQSQAPSGSPPASFEDDIPF